MAETLQTATAPQRRYGASIGQPLTRRDGFLKVTGQARYAADNHPPGTLHAVLAVSSIARGRITFLDVAAARAHPGVVEVMTSANRPPLALDPDAKFDPFMMPATSSSASVPPTLSPWSPPQRACRSRTGSSPRHGWRWAA